MILGRNPFGVALLTAAAATALLGAAACGANHESPEGAGPVPADTVRGVVLITGAEPITSVTLRTDEGRSTLSGAVADTLRAASGVEVWVSGRRGVGGEFEVSAFRVRAVDGVPAADGVLELDGAAAVLVTPTGERLRYEPVSPGLRSLEGRRVWIAGRPGAEPQRWGVLDDRS